MFPVTDLIVNKTGPFVILKKSVPVFRVGMFSFYDFFWLKNVVCHKFGILRVSNESDNKMADTK